VTSYLIPYIDPRKIDGHEDPMLDEYTYGDVGERGKKLLEKVKKGDFLFFHTSSRNQRVITAYYHVEEVMPASIAWKDVMISTKYRNPHLKREPSDQYDTIVFGNPVRSFKLKTPLPLTRSILNKFSKRVNLNEKQTEFAAISSSLRSWKELDNNDIELLIKEILVLQREERLKDVYLSNEEILQLDEIDIEDFLVSNPKNLNKDYEFLYRQIVLNSNRRIDVLLKNEIKKELIVVEIKKGLIGKEAYKQIHGYKRELEQDVKIKYGMEKVKGIIVCNGILPAFEDFYYDLMTNKTDIEIMFYAWKFSFKPF
jgi:predicted nuclease of restriction endonuclease-like (RecB) superfamily